MRGWLVKKWHTYAVNRAKGYLTFNQVVAGSIPARPTIESNTYVSSGEVYRANGVPILPLVGYLNMGIMSY